MDRTEELKKIRDEILNLKKSPLYKFRTENKYFPVIGEGSHFAKIMFVGEAPGENEAKTGHPFCGAAGRILDEMLASIGLDRKSVYVTNIVKDRPPANRDPLPEEIALYSPFLFRQINIIKPQIIATLGRFSTKYILEKFNCPQNLQSISLLHGKTIEAKADLSTVKIVPLYHPAVALYRGTLKKILLEDIKVLKQVS